VGIFKSCRVSSPLSDSWLSSGSHRCTEKVSVYEFRQGGGAYEKTATPHPFSGPF
jgi:hypothetical protein